MRKWDDTLLLKCFDGKLKNDFIREDEEVVEARLSFLEKNQRYILNTNFLCLLGWPDRAEYKFSNNITMSLYS